MDTAREGYLQAAALLPRGLRDTLLSHGADRLAVLEELRLRVGRPMTGVFPEGEQRLGEAPVTQRELEQLLEIASGASLHAVAEQLSEGYLTVRGGHRLGLCGVAVTEGGQIRTLRNLSSAAIRIAHAIPGIARETAGQLYRDGLLQSTLILAPPGAGKTTLLRDLIRVISQGEGVPPLRVGVVDQRGELGGGVRGVPQLELGSRTDILEGAPRAQGLMLLLRAMNPQVLAVDEITDSRDAQALLRVRGCGVALLATAHGAGLRELRGSGLYGGLGRVGLFQRLVTIERRGGERRCRVEVLE